MKTDIEYLRQLDTDLGHATVREASRQREAATPARRRAGHVWIRVAGVAAVFLVVAGSIGFLASNSARDKFQEVSDAVTGGGGLAEEPTLPSRAPNTDESRDGVLLPGAPGPNQRLQDLSKIIRDGRIGLVVPDGKFGEAVGDLTFIAEQHGGFILSSSTNNDRSGTFVLRIPARGFDRALGDIRDLATHVRFQDIRGEDVTAEYIDQQARLRILLARKALLFDLFQQANTTEEILQMSGQLDAVQLRIEQIQGQIRFINDQVAESTLRVSIQERNAPEAVAPGKVDEPDLGSSFDLAVQGFLRVVGAVMIGLGYLIPLTVLGALAWMLIWFVRRRRTLSA